MVSILKREWQAARGPGKAYVVIWREGHRQRQKQFPKRREAEAFAGRLMAGRIDQLAPGAALVSVSDAIETFRETLRLGRDGSPPVAPATAKQYEWAFRYIEAALGPVLLADLRRVQLLDFRDSLLRRDLSRKSAAHIVKALKAILNEAQRRELIGRDCWSQVTVRGQAPPRVTIPTRGEAGRLLTTAERLAGAPGRTGATWRRYHPLIVTALLTGLRQQELRALRWGDIDFGRGLIEVARAADAWGRIKETKSVAGRRQVELPSELAKLLQGWREVCETPDAEGLVFPAPSGGVLDKSNLYHRAWKVLLAKSGLVDAGLRFHALRHYYASSLIAAGATGKEVQSALGHSSIEITFDTYGHLFPEDRRERRRRVARIAAQLLRG